MSVLRGGQASGLVFGGQTALQVVVCMSIRLVPESPFHPPYACHLGRSVAEVTVHSLVRLRKRARFPTPLSSLLVTLALNHEQLGKRSCPCAWIACCLSLLAPCEQRESLGDRFSAGMLSTLYLGLVFLEKGSL